MIFTKKGSKGRRLDVSARRKRKCTRPMERQHSHQLLNHAPRNDSIASLTSEPSLTPESEEETIILSSDSDDSTLELDDRKARRIAIAFQFTNILLSPPRSEWTATAKLICENLRTKTMRLEQMCNMFDSCVLSAENDAAHDGDRKKRLEAKDAMISTNSAVAQIIADAVEDGWSERQAVAIVNKYLLENADEFITRNQLRSLAQRMKPVSSAVEKAKQGSSDPDVP